MKFSKRILKAVNEGVYRALADLDDEEDVVLTKSNIDLDAISKKSNKQMFSFKIEDLIFDDNHDFHINKDIYIQILELYSKGGKYIVKSTAELRNIVTNTLNDIHLSCNLNWLDVSNIKDMSYLFSAFHYFNADISEWDVHNVENAYSMFDGCYSFNGNLSKWRFEQLIDGRNAFDGCLELVYGPSYIGPRVTQCREMFLSCKQLQTAPELSAAHLTNSIYESMFESCYNLKAAPKLIATKLAPACYKGMFKYCKSLIDTPELPALTLEKDCYKSMFAHCDALNIAPKLPAMELAENCYQYMFSCCGALAEMPELPATILKYGCYDSMFQLCMSFKETKELPATELATECYANMFFRCENLISGPKILPAMKLKPYCYAGMFNACYKLVNAPILPAKILSDYCYLKLFRHCCNLKCVKCLATSGSPADYIFSINNSSYFDEWLDDVSDSGVFIKSLEADFWDDQDIIPPLWDVQNDK